ncbi:MAG: hypothetical protein M1457_03825 [bacterium]|nr:hypothetical protein [bacterium]
MTGPAPYPAECLYVDFDGICDAFPGRGERLETLLIEYVGLYHAARAEGATIVIRSDRAADAGHRRRVTRHLERIGMPFDAILLGRLLGMGGSALR